MHFTTKQLAYAALCLAISFALGFITLFTMPQGGRITLASILPVIIFAYIYGPKKGFIVALIFSVLRFVQEPLFLLPVQFLLDYIFAYTAIGFAGFFRKNIIPGIAVSGALIFFCQFLSGILFYAEYAPAGQPAWLYSLIYNGSTVAVETAICIIVTVIPPVFKFIKNMKLKAENGEI